jgi:signal transduction histidine kinase
MARKYRFFSIHLYLTVCMVNSSIVYLRNNLLRLLLVAGIPLASWALSTPPSKTLEERPLADLEERIKEIDKNLKELSHFTLRGGVGAIGYRTKYYRDARKPQTLSVSWDKPEPLDEIILVPVIRREQANHYEADGFPIEFSVYCGTSDPGNEKLLATFSRTNALLPRIAPLVIPCDGTEASWLRIETTLLSKGAFDERHIFQLAEVMVFNGQRNVALHGKVIVDDDRRGGGAWKQENLVDGFVPYLMDSAFGETSPAVVSKQGAGDPATLTIDLGEPFAIERIQLHSAQVGDTVPYMFDSRFGIPQLLRVEGSLAPDFKESVLLLDFKQASAFDTAPIITRHIEPKTCRYVQFVARNPYFPRLQEDQTRFGFAEIELFSGDRNVALGKPSSANFNLGYYANSTAQLTDGHNLYGKILPLRDWLNELALRHELEKEHPIIAAELNRRYTQQKKQLTWLIRLAVLLGVSIVSGVFIEWAIRQRVIYRTRERIAADIHDELGANLHAIGLLGNLARKLKESPEEQDDVLGRLQEMTKRTGLAARYCTNTLESKELYEDIVEDMRRTTERLVADLDHEITFEGEDLLRRLKPRKRIDLFLFYKECLTNVIRHSDASQVSTRVEMTPKHLSLTVSDNGQGTHGIAPRSLRRRARLLGAKVRATTPEGGGACIQLLRTHKKWDVMKGDSA